MANEDAPGSDIDRLAQMMEEGADDLHMAPAFGLDDFKDNYPIAVNTIRLGSIGVEEPLTTEIGSWVAVRAVDSDKTLLGVLLGDLPVSPMVRYRPATGELFFAMRNNPAIWVPELGRIVFGYESWWGKIKSPEHLRTITDDDIQSVWYVQALKALTEAEGDAAETNRSEDRRIIVGVSHQIDEVDGYRVELTLKCGHTETVLGVSQPPKLGDDHPCQLCAVRGGNDGKASDRNQGVEQ